MSKKLLPPRILRVEETHFGKIFANDPKAQARHEQIVRELREEAREEVAACERSERLTYEDLHVPTFW